MEVFMFDVNFADEFKIITAPALSASGELLREKLADLDFTSHYAIFSSGTTSRELKGYILSEKSMEANAHAVNEWFGLTPEDVWGLSLPVYHVGGLSVLVRARLLGNRVVDLRGWDPLKWHRNITDESVTITTIVPTQLYDLVSLNLTSPAQLKKLIVGGDFLATELEASARALGWPVIRTYGMTEVCSQLASGKDPGDALRILPIHEVRRGPGDILQVKTPSLFTTVFTMGEKFGLKFSHDLVDAEGFYETSDVVQIQGDSIIPQGRRNQEIKIAGHLTNVLALKDSLSTCLLREGLYGQAEITVESEERKGNRLVLIHKNLPADMLTRIAEAVRPAIIDEFRSVTELSRTDLGKFKSVR